MRRIAWLTAVIFACIMPHALAETEATPESLLDDVGFERVEQFSESIDGIDAGEIVRTLMTGEASLSKDTLLQWGAEIAQILEMTLGQVLMQLAVPIVLSIVLRALLGRSAAAQKGGQLFCRVACITIMAGVFVEARQTAGQLINRAVEVSDVMAPVLISALTLTGAATSSAILSPMAALCASLIENFLSTAGLMFSGCAAAMAMAGSLSERFSLDRLFRLVKSGLNWMVGVLMTAFMGVLSVQGLLGSGHDSAAARSVRYAVESVIPVIGGEVSDTMDSLVSSALVMKNAVGVTGMLLLLGTCLTPVLRLFAAMLSLKLTAAIVEPVADRGIVKAIGQFGDATEMLLVAAIGCVVMVLLLLGACLAAAGNIVR